MSEDATTTDTPGKVTVYIPITKGKGTLAVVTDDIPADVWAEVILQGLKVLLNRGASKITKEAHKGDEAAMRADAMKVAETQLQKVMTSDIKLTGGKAKTAKAPAKVMARAMQLARVVVNEELKRVGLKPSHVEASEKTKAAKAFLATEKGTLMIERARKEIEELEAEMGGDDSIVAGIAVSEKLIAKAAAKKAKDKATKPLSAKQAGMVKSRTKGEARPTAH